MFKHTPPAATVPLPFIGNWPVVACCAVVGPIHFEPDKLVASLAGVILTNRIGGDKWLFSSYFWRLGAAVMIEAGVLPPDA